MKLMQKDYYLDYETNTVRHINEIVMNAEKDLEPGPNTASLGGKRKTKRRKRCRKSNKRRRR
jgi:hypothetical protein